MSNRLRKRKRKREEKKERGIKLKKIFHLLLDAAVVGARTLPVPYGFQCYTYKYIYTYNIRVVCTIHLFAYAIHYTYIHFVRCACNRIIYVFAGKLLFWNIMCTRAAAPCRRRARARAYTSFPRKHIFYYSPPHFAVVHAAGLTTTKFHLDNFSHPPWCYLLRRAPGHECCTSPLRVYTARVL